MNAFNSTKATSWSADLRNGQKKVFKPETRNEGESQ